MNERPDACPRCGYVMAQPPPPPVVSYVAPYPAAAPRPAPTPAARGGIAAASVPKILLGLGATCLLVAAVIFLAVAWSSLGVGGRTAVLVALTAASALSGQWLGRRDLGVAAEALTSVSLGLVVLDTIGANDAGWLGTPDAGEFLTVLGGVLLGVSMSLCLSAHRLFSPQVVAPVGLGVALVGVGASTMHLQLLAAVAVLCFTGLAVFGRQLAAVVLPWTAGTGALLAWTALTGLAAAEASEHPTLRGLWPGGHALGMLAAVALVLLPWAVVRGHADLRQPVCAVSACLLTWTVVLPALDEGLTAITLAAAVTTVFWALVAAAAPPAWYAVPRVPLVGALLGLAPATALLGLGGLTNLFTVAAPFTADATVRLQPLTPEVHPLLLPLGVAVVALAAVLTVPRAGRSRFGFAGLAALTGLLTAAQYPLPLWVFVAVLGPLGVVLALPSAVLTLLTLGEVVLVAAYVLFRRTGGAASVAALVLPLALGTFLWTAGHVLEWSYGVRSLLTLLVLGLSALALPRLGLALSAVATVVVSTAVAVPQAPDPSVSLAVHLTLAGALVVACSLVHRELRAFAWPGGLLLAAATWVRLYDVGVHAPEPYTLPTAVVLLLVGLHRLTRDSVLDTVPALLPGLGLALAPTLLWALVDPLSGRAVAVGLAALVLLLGGTVLRWTAPVLVGWLAGAAIVLREAAPYAAQWPQWVLIGAAGTVLVGAGITWEARLRDLRQAAAYLGRLR